MKRLLCILLVLCVMVSVSSIQVFAEDDKSNGGTDVTWRYDEATKMLIIGGSGEMPDLYYDFMGVMMYERPWDDIEDSIKVIEIGNSVTSIGGFAFCDCDGLLKVTIPDSLTSIGVSAFNGCENLSTVSMGKSVTYIGENAFRDCCRLSKITLPDSVTFIGDYAFYDNSLTEINIPDSVTTIGKETFYGCNSLEQVDWGNGITTIGESAFSHCGIKKIVLPDSVTSIGNYAFKECWNLLTLGIPDSVISVGEAAFLGCDSLTYAYVGDSVDSIKSKTFGSCDNLTLVDLGNSVSSIGKNAFGNCVKLRQVNIGNSLTSIGDEAFYNCKNLYSINFPKSVTSIGRSAFYNCDSLRTIIFQDNILYIDTNAFFECSNLTDIYYCGSEEQWNEIAIGSNAIPSQVEIHYDYEAPCDHVEVVDEAVEATCTSTGLTAGSHCSECGEILKKQETTPLAAHQWKNSKCVVCGEPMGNPFKDVSESDWYYNSVLWAAGNGITGGTSATTFSPNDGCTRAQVVTFLWAANGKPEPTSMGNPFTDVADNAWYLKPVLWAVENGITTGVTATEFGPNRTCTRAQIATFLYAAAGKPTVSGKSSFKDVKDADWFAKPIIWAAENEVTGGIGEGKFGPNNTCTRAQVVTFLYKVYG